MKRIGDIGLWENVVPEDLCNDLIQHFESSDTLKTRDEEKCKDTYMFLYDGALRRKFGPILRDCGDEYFEFYGHNTWRKQCQPTTMKIQKAQAGGGFTGIHWEQGAGQLNAPRFGAWMAYLNTVEKGGCTAFPLQDRLMVKPTRGTMVIWPAAYTHPHHSFPDLGEDKYILTGWFQYQIENKL